MLVAIFLQIRPVNHKFSPKTCFNFARFLTFLFFLRDQPTCQALVGCRTFVWTGADRPWQWQWHNNFKQPWLVKSLRRWEVLQRCCIVTSIKSNIVVLTDVFRRFLVDSFDRFLWIGGIIQDNHHSKEKAMSTIVCVVVEMFQVSSF